MDKEIILIGPIGVGKSTVGQVLSKKLNIPQCSLDFVRFKYYDEIGYSSLKERLLWKFKGFIGVYKYWKPFEAYSVERVLNDYPDHIIDFGGGQSVYEDDNLFMKVQKLLKPYKNIFLLLPTEDKEKSFNILQSRQNCDINRHFIEHKSNYELAKHIIYTEGKTPDMVADEIIKNISNI